VTFVQNASLEFKGSECAGGNLVVDNASQKTGGFSRGGRGGRGRGNLSIPFNLLNQTTDGGGRFGGFGGGGRGNRGGGFGGRGRGNRGGARGGGRNKPRMRIDAGMETGKRIVFD